MKLFLFNIIILILICCTAMFFYLSLYCLIYHDDCYCVASKFFEHVQPSVSRALKKMEKYN